MVKLPSDMVDPWRHALGGRTVCVTGGCGFIGGHLVDALVGLGATVRVIDDLSSSSVEHLAGMLELEPERVEFVHGSILDRDALDDAVRGCHVVFHLAAIGSVPRSVREPGRTWQVNATGTLRVLEAARSHLVERVVYSASSSAYGNGPAGPAPPGAAPGRALGRVAERMSGSDDGNAPDNGSSTGSSTGAPKGATPEGADLRTETQAPDPRSPYAASKLAGEHLCRSWSESYGLSTACLRYFNIFGARQPGDSAYAAVIPAFVRRVLAGEPPVVEGDGRQTRDFTHVSNAVCANLLAATSEVPLRGEAVNIGAGERTSVIELAGRVAAGLGREDLVPVHVDPRPGDVRGSVADLTRARGMLGYRPGVSFGDGLAETLAWSREVHAGAHAEADGPSRGRDDARESGPGPAERAP